METGRMPVRKHLNTDALLDCCRKEFGKIADHRSGGVEILLPDALIAGVALFQMKDPSLLAFQKRGADDNFRFVHGITRLPSDTQMREILDEVDPESLRPAFTAIFGQLQRGKVLETMRYLDEGLLLALDGVEYFCSDNVHCSKCMQRQRRGHAEPEYYHQMLGAVIVHPEKKQVLALMPEPIQQQDGTKKNDCERNAGIRFLQKFRGDHPHLEVVVVEDGLGSNGPHIRQLKACDCHFILGAKDGDHASLQKQLDAACERGAAHTHTVTDPETNLCHRFVWATGLYLNDSNRDLLVNYLRYQQEAPDGKSREFTWVTDLELRPNNVYRIMRAGRARWKIENETFNTLKNQGYHFGHNFGHGQNHLSVIFSLLMMLAFLIDQVQELTNHVFQKAMSVAGCKRTLWENLRSLWASYRVTSMRQLHEALAHGFKKPNLQPKLNNSS